MLPKAGKKAVTASPGQFPYRPVISADMSTATYTVEVSQPFWVSAHAVVAWYE